MCFNLCPMAAQHSPSTWVITGAASGFGREFALRVARRGEPVALWDRDREGLTETSRLLGNARHQSFVVDVTSYESVVATAEATQSTLGTVHHVVTSAGILRVGDAATVGAEATAEMMRVNYLGSVHTALALLPQLRQGTGRRRLLFIASVAGLRGFPELAGYSGSKFAVVGYAQALREEVGEAGIQVQVLCPPAGDTPMLRSIEEKPAIFRLSALCSAEEVVSAAFEGMKSDSLLILVDNKSKWVRRVDRLRPGLVDRLVRFAK